MTRSPLGVAVLACLCSCQPDVNGPTAPRAPDNVQRRAVAIDIDLRTGTATVRGSQPDRTSGPSFAILGRNEVSATLTNFSRSAVGEFTPYRVRVRFDLALTNRLQHADLIPSTFPEAPGADVVAFPFATDPAGLFGLKVRASSDWDVAPHNFFNDAICIAVTPPSDCFRSEPFGVEIGAGATTGARRVGFDVDPSVSSFTVYVAVAADLRENGGTGTGGAGLAGNVVSLSRGPLPDITVSVGSRSSATNAAGFYTLGGLAAGVAQIVLSGLPEECADPGPRDIALIDGEVADGSVQIECRGRIRGRVISPQLGPLPNVTVTAQGTGLSATTDANGDYLLAGIDDPTVLLSLTGLVGDCRPPAPVSVVVPPGQTTTAADISVPCSPIRVVFTALTGTNTEMFIMKADGTERRQLTFTPEDERFAALSPDANRIAFNREISGNFSFWTMNVDGSGETAKISGSVGWPRPRWLFDGSGVVMINALGLLGHPDGALVMYLFGDPADRPHLVDPGDEIRKFLPTPSYTDNKVAYVTSVSVAVPSIRIATLNDIGQAHVDLPLASPMIVRELAWSPDGSRIVFESGTNSNGNIVTRSTHPLGETSVLTAGIEDDSDPVYSPDGGSIYFIRNGAFYRMNAADGSSPVEIVPAAEFGAGSIDVR